MYHKIIVPISGESVNISFPVSLAEGITLHKIKTSKFKTNSISFYFNFPLERKTITKISLLANLLASASYNQNLSEISKRLEDLYGASLRVGVTKKGNGLILYFSCNFVNSKFVDKSMTIEIVKLLKELILDPATVDKFELNSKKTNSFRQTNFKKEKQNLKQHISSIKNDKVHYTLTKCIEIMFKNEPYGISECGYVNDLKTIDASELATLYQHLLKNYPIDIFFHGDFQDEDVNKILCEEFNVLFSPRQRLYFNSEFCKRNPKKEKIITEEQILNQSKISIGAACNASYSDLPSLAVTNSIFGSGTHSKLFTKVREKLSLAYYCSSQLDSDIGAIVISAGIEADKFNIVLEEIKNQLAEIKTGNFNDDDIDYSRKYAINKLLSIKDSKMATESFYYDKIIKNEEKTIDDCVEEISKVGRFEIIKCANQITFDTIFFLKQTS